MRNESASSARLSRVLKFMELQSRSLAHTNAAQDIQLGYSAIIRYLGRLPESEIERLFAQSKSKKENVDLRQELMIGDPETLSLEDAEAIARDESSPRKLLELIAISRFQVPRGSMRSFSNVRALREKIITMIQNERGHETVSLMAKNFRK